MTDVKNRCHQNNTSAGYRWRLYAFVCQYLAKGLLNVSIYLIKMFAPSSDLVQ